MAKFLVLNGPNLNLLGRREPETYGHETLDDIRARCLKFGNELQHRVDFYQSNAEHELLEKIHGSFDDGTDFIVINPGALTHTSVALRDALLGVRVPFIELHLSNVYAREPFRHHSYLSDVAVGIVSGFGGHGYELALNAASQWLASRTARS